MSSFVANHKYKVSSGLKLYARRFVEEISYTISQKIAANIRERGVSAALLSNFGSQKEIDPFEEAKSIPVVTYHGLPSEGEGQLSHKLVLEQLKALRDDGWETISLEQFENFMNGKEVLRKKSFLLTFDDGRKDSFYPADPILKDLGYNAVMFAITKKSIGNLSEDSSYYLSEYELKNMDQSSRWVVESHGRDSHDWYFVDDNGNTGHFFGNKLWLQNEQRIETDDEYLERIKYDLTRSKSELETTLDRKITVFALPFGEYGQSSINYSQSKEILLSELKKIYNFTFYQVWQGEGETFNYPRDNQFMVKRIEPQLDWSGEYLVSMLNSGLVKDLPYKTESYGMEWVQSWGTVNGGNELTLTAKKNTGGATALLNGSYLWQDYDFSSDVKLINGSNVVLFGRRENNKNYFGCNFESNKVSIKELDNGISKNLVTVNALMPKNVQINLSARFIGDTITCLIDGEEVISRTVGMHSKGGVGVEVWNRGLGSAEAVFSNISISPL